MEFKHFKKHIRSQYGDKIDELINEMFLMASDYAKAEDEDSTLRLVETIKYLMPFSNLTTSLKFIIVGFMGDFYISTGRLADAEKSYEIGSTILNKYQEGTYRFTPIQREMLKMEFNMSDEEIDDLKNDLSIPQHTIDSFLDMKLRIEEYKKNNNQ
jgi:hypothetical protein